MADPIQQKRELIDQAVALQPASDLIDQAVALIQALPNALPRPYAMPELAAIILIRKVSMILQHIPDVGESAYLRQEIYGLLQSQKGDGNCAIYKELTCSICTETLGYNGSPATIPCGHSYCKNCIQPVIIGYPAGRVCPDCRTPIPAGTVLKDNIAIKSIVDRLKPRAGGGRRKRKLNKSRKNRRH